MTGTPVGSHPRSSPSSSGRFSMSVVTRISGGRGKARAAASRAREAPRIRHFHLRGGRVRSVMSWRERSRRAVDRALWLGPWYGSRYSTLAMRLLPAELRSSRGDEEGVRLVTRHTVKAAVDLYRPLVGEEDVEPAAGVHAQLEAVVQVSGARAAVVLVVEPEAAVHIGPQRLMSPAIDDVAVH